MPPPPDFDYYEALGVEKNASQQEIISSYRRLALQHHPDRDPDNPDATANFQRIQAAYEALSDSAKRASYDDFPSRHNPHTSFRQHSYGYDDFDDEFEYYFNEKDSDDGISSFDEFFGGDFFSSRGGGFSRGMPPAFEEMRAQFAEDEEYEKRERDLEEKMRQKALAEYRARQERLEEETLAREKAKKAEEDAMKQAFKTREKNERVAQDKRWAESHASTEAERQSSCLHSEFWTKMQQKKKFKCGTCRQKRGMSAFKCPHCSLLACQVCLNTFAEKRRQQMSDSF